MGPNATVRTVLLVLGGVLLFFAVLARIESHEEHHFIRILDVLIGLMLAVCLGCGREANPARRKMTIVRVLLLWLVVSGPLLAWHEFQIYARTTLARRLLTRHVISETYEALRHFSQDCGSFPSESQGLIALCRNPGLSRWDGPYVSDVRYLKDPWQNQLQYALHDSEPTLWSCGPDGVSETDDDLTWAYGDGG